VTVIILAGGLGTRLHPITKDQYPKCMVPINGKPFLYYILKNLVENYTLDKLILSVGHKHEHIKDYFGDNFWGVLIEYCIEKEPLGTAGAVKKVLKEKYIKGNTVVIMNGDTYTITDLNKMMECHEDNKTKSTVAIFQNHDWIKGFYPVRAGVYILDKELGEGLPTVGNIDDELKEVNYFDNKNDFIDIGTPDGYTFFKEVLCERLTKQESN
jgi:NDP-sugar pyrophosphorylase family protein